MYRMDLTSTGRGTTTRTGSVPAARGTSGWDGETAAKNRDFWTGLRDCSRDGGLLAGSGEASPADDVGQLSTSLGMAGGDD